MVYRSYILPTGNRRNQCNFVAGSQHRVVAGEFLVDREPDRAHGTSKPFVTLSKETAQIREGRTVGHFQRHTLRVREILGRPEEDNINGNHGFLLDRQRRCSLLALTLNADLAGDVGDTSAMPLGCPTGSVVLIRCHIQGDNR